jgi:hypothetical protein
MAEKRSKSEVLEQYVGQLAEVVQARNVPQYDMQSEAWEWAVFANLSQGRLLPGRATTGLTDFQKHLAIALGRLCLKHGAGFCNAEMGSGKTTVGIAVAEYLRAYQQRQGQDETAYPALVVGPGVVSVMGRGWSGGGHGDGGACRVRNGGRKCNAGWNAPGVWQR